MNYLINKCELNVLKSKSNFPKVSAGDLISIVYFDIEKEKTLLQAFVGRCTKVKNKGLSTKIVVENKVLNVLFKQSFFLYGPNLLDLKIFHKKN